MNMLRTIILFAALGGAYWYLQPRNSGIYRGYYWAILWERHPGDPELEGWWYTIKEPDADGVWVEFARDFAGGDKAAAKSAAKRQIDRFAFEEGPGDAPSAPERVAGLIP